MLGGNRLRIFQHISHFITFLFPPDSFNALFYEQAL